MDEVAALVREATTLLEDAGQADPARQARVIVAHVLGVEPSRVALRSRIDEDGRERVLLLVGRRCQGVPLQHLLGRAWFRHVDVAVGPGVFIPRPETEVMTGWVIDRLAGSDGRVVVELCAGSGVISRSIAIEAPGHRQYAVELSDDAVPFLRANLADVPVEVVHADMADALTDLDGTVDVLVANPPYIPLDAYEHLPAEVRDHEPSLALFSGADGLDALRVVADVAARLLRPGGVLASEHADVQGDSAPGVLVDHGAFDLVRDHGDLNGRPRFVTARRIPAPGGDGRMRP